MNLKELFVSSLLGEGGKKKEKKRKKWMIRIEKEKQVATNDRKEARNENSESLV